MGVPYIPHHRRRRLPGPNNLRHHPAIAYTNTSLSLVTAGTERLVIGTAGNVGIGQQPASGVAVAISGTASISSNTKILGNTSTTTLQLANNPPTACTTATLGTFKLINGRPFICRQ